MGDLGAQVDLDSLDGGLTIKEFKEAKLLRSEWNVQTATPEDTEVPDNQSYAAQTLFGPKRKRY